MSLIEKRYYDAQSLKSIIDSFEKRFEIDSAVFYEAHYADDESVVGGIPAFHRHSWASFYREWRQMSSDGFAATVKRELELA